MIEANPPPVKKGGCVYTRGRNKHRYSGFGKILIFGKTGIFPIFRTMKIRVRRSYLQRVVQ